ncbi:SDR family oxidoreductase [Ammoniphilus sp. CFH 90114]|uniref:SDR family NAD(P)-dependent oxidoreductase n=1 Tax=Ammoniphilus sp. CFH 90114 TaxID=2493665 RepID=UPI00100F073B|nr:SDR family oxidoreductase [Ammoniphilus sp. CFH 90114]RXT15265.1 SDR family oxidoreductase [Ammoniphilus sp. CFH 90114]
MGETKGKSVLITGASSGIGYELAKCFAIDGYHLILCARREEKLVELAQHLQDSFQAKSSIIVQDLADPSAPAELLRKLEGDGLKVDILVNNAGFGLYGLFSTLDTQEILDMIQVNISSLTHLTKLLLPGMMERGNGKILNVASTAAFQPGPLMAVYYATKAYVLSFSEALANEVEPHGISVSALCPGPTETGFEKRANLEKSKLFQGVNMDAATVARIGYVGLLQGKTIIIPGLKNQILASSVRLAPRKMLTKVVRRLQETRK